MLNFARCAAALAIGLTIAGSATASTGEPTTCDDAMIGSVLGHASAPDDGHLRASACRFLDRRSGLVAVAIAYEPSGYDWRNNVNLPVYVAWYDSRTASVVASARADIGEDAATQVTESSLKWNSFRDLGRDAAALLVNDFVLQGAMDGDTGPTWTLFVADGPRLQAVIGPAMLSYAQCSRACRDAGVSDRHTRVLSLAPARQAHNGLHDVVATLHDSTKHEPSRQQLRFNGQRYEPNVDELVSR